MNIAIILFDNFEMLDLFGRLPKHFSIACWIAREMEYEWNGFE